jgi:hypothetical protein
MLATCRRVRGSARIVVSRSGLAAVTHHSRMTRGEHNDGSDGARRPNLRFFQQYIAGRERTYRVWTERLGTDSERGDRVKKPRDKTVLGGSRNVEVTDKEVGTLRRLLSQILGKTGNASKCWRPGSRPRSRCDQLRHCAALIPNGVWPAQYASVVATIVEKMIYLSNHLPPFAQ